ncbi:hypothetical protein BGW80DRAFT_1252850 [Lactifluus volemus]|nr:hypothetical protein BGW80DRAFT_1252850 [Lactifluus volemus]
MSSFCLAYHIPLTFKATEILSRIKGENDEALPDYGISCAMTFTFLTFDSEHTYGEKSVFELNILRPLFPPKSVSQPLMSTTSNELTSKIKQSPAAPYNGTPRLISESPVSTEKIDLQEPPLESPAETKLKIKWARFVPKNSRNLWTFLTCLIVLAAD